MKKFILPLFLFSSFMLNAQVKPSGKQIRVIVGLGNHGTGDLRGMGFSTEYEQSFSRRFCWAVGLGGTIHQDADYLIYLDPGGMPREGSLRHTTAGAQATGYIGFKPLKISLHEIQVRLGGLIRYQSSSIPDIYFIDFSQGSPYPVFGFDHRSPQSVFTVGYSAQVMYQFAVSRKINIGAVAGFQNDTEGDVISQVSLSVGRKL